MFISLYYAMKLAETIIKYKDDYVIIRFDPNEKDIRKYNRSEYRTGREWRR